MLSTLKRVGPLVIAVSFVFAGCSSGAGATPAPTTGSSTATTTGASGGAVPPAGSMAAPACATGSTTAAGSTALQPVVDAAGKRYAAACAGATVSVQGGGSGTGLTQVLQGAVNIGDSDVKAEDKLKPDEASQLVDHVIAKQGWVLVNNPSVTGVTNLTTQQATDIWTGKTTNWKDVGGPDQPIVLIIRPASSGTRATFKKIVLGGQEEAAGQALTEDSNGAVTTAVAGTPGATSVIGLAYYLANKGTVTALQLDGVDASVDNIKNGTYKLQAEGHAYTKGAADGITKSFLDYLLSPDVQGTLLPSLGYAGAGH